MYTQYQAETSLFNIPVAETNFGFKKSYKMTTIEEPIKEILEARKRRRLLRVQIKNDLLAEKKQKQSI